MKRFALAALAALLLLAPATASGVGADTSRVHLRGTVAQTLPANKLVRVDTTRVAHILRVPGSQARIHVGQRVVLRGTTLLERGNRSRVLARGVVVAGSARKGSSSVSSASSSGSGSDDAGRLEIRGNLTSLAPPTVSSGSVSASCSLPAGQTLTGFAVGDFVEMKCVLALGVWIVRELRHEDDQVANPPNDDDDTDTGDTDDSDDTTDDDSGDDDDSSGPGGGNSGHGGGDD